jgi:small subunit ribosomal protein S1
MEIGSQALWVDIGVKRDGLVPGWDLKRLDEEAVEALAVGEEVPVFVVRPRDREGHLVLSISRGNELKDWQKAERLLSSGDITQHQVQDHNKGGVVVSFGQLRGFVPASHLDIGARGLSGEARRQALAELVGERLPLKVIEVNRRRRRLVLSHRQAVREQRERRKMELLETLAAGDVRSGTVRSLHNFGAFVDIGGADGLVHVSEISHRRIRHPREKLEVGEKVEVYVLRLDHERERIGLSIKRLVPDPWESVQSRYYPGQLVEATITNVLDFGAFAALETGLEGLIHISRLSHVHVDHPSDVVAIGDMVTLRILHIDIERRRIGLSLKDAPQWVEVPAEELSEGDWGVAPDQNLQPADPRVALLQSDVPFRVTGEVAAQQN